MVRCFLIEDDPDDQEIFLMALRAIDPAIQCDVANGGLQALAWLGNDQSFIPDYIFVDHSMPKMTGLECLGELRKLKHLSKARVIMFSTSSEPKIVERCRLLGADDFVVKPPTLGDMVGSINQLIIK